MSIVFGPSFLIAVEKNTFAKSVVACHMPMTTLLFSVKDTRFDIAVTSPLNG